MTDVGEAEGAELGDGLRRQRGGAGAGTGRGAVEDEHVEPGRREVCGSGGTGGAGSDDDDVRALEGAGGAGVASGIRGEDQRHTLLVNVFTNTVHSMHRKSAPALRRP